VRLQKVAIAQYSEVSIQNSKFKCSYGLPRIAADFLIWKSGNQPTARLRREQTIGQLEILRDLRVSAVKTELRFTAETRRTQRNGLQSGLWGILHRTESGAMLKPPRSKIRQSVDDEA